MLREHHTGLGNVDYFSFFPPPFSKIPVSGSEEPAARNINHKAIKISPQIYLSRTHSFPTHSCLLRGFEDKHNKKSCPCENSRKRLAGGRRQTTNEIRDEKEGGRKGSLVPSSN
jgi:hypothetical protein